MELTGQKDLFIPFSELYHAFDPQETLLENTDFDIKKTEKSLVIQNGDSTKEILLEPGPGVFNKEAEKVALYKYLRGLFKDQLDWGVLTGVKPVKVFKKAVNLGLDPQDYFMDRLLISPKKIELVREIYERQKEALATYGDDYLSLYVGIPICPSKCSYCSFVSTVADKKGVLVSEYLKNLKEEIRFSKDYLKRWDKKIASVYIGGGTPSVFDPEQARELLTTLKNELEIPESCEFTFEAGRPDTTSRELLEVLKDNGVNRICLNPQSFHDKTLKAIGRNHTAQDVVDTYKIAKDVGFSSINMDLIFGLPGESEAEILDSLETATALKPENITVHNLSVKKGSRLKEEFGHKIKPDFSPDFYERAEALLRPSYAPYYLYRQKYTVGNGENTGYSKPGHESLYNILMLAEEQSILGIGAGSSGKLYDKKIDQFTPVFTVKDVRTYNNRLEEILEKKQADYERFSQKIDPAI